MQSVIFGGNGGVGQVLAQRLHQQGATITLVGRNLEALEEVAAPLDAQVYQCDVTDSTALADTCRAIAAKGSIRHLAYAVGSIVLKPIKTATEADYADTFALNTIAPALILKHFSSHFSDKAAVVLFSSIAARQGFANHAVIASAKAGVEGLVLSAAAELAPKVRVNAVAQSLTDTPLASMFTRNPDMVKAIAAMHPLQRIGTADDVAAAAAYLLSDDASWISGEILNVSGGRHALRPKG